MSLTLIIGSHIRFIKRVVIFKVVGPIKIFEFEVWGSCFQILITRTMNKNE